VSNHIKRKNPGISEIPGFLVLFDRKKFELALGELGSATGGLQTVLLRLEKRKTLEPQGLFDMPFKFNP